MESDLVRNLEEKIKDMELEVEIERRKREVERLEAKKKIKNLEEEIERIKRKECRENVQERFKVRSEVRRVEKRKAEDGVQQDAYGEEKGKKKIVLKRGWKGKDLNVEEWMEENYKEVRIRSVVERGEGIYVLWLEKDSDREMLMEKRDRNNRWHQFYIEEWISTEEWIRRVREKGESLRREREREESKNRREGVRRKKQRGVSENENEKEKEKGKANIYFVKKYCKKYCKYCKN